MISEIISPLVVGLFDTNISQSSCSMDSYSPPNTMCIEDSYNAMIGENRQLVTNEPVEFEK